jgi:hypothetical protein
VRGRCDGGPGGTPYNGPMSLTRPDVMRGPRFTSTGPVQEPPSPPSFPCVGHAQRRYSGARAKPLKFATFERRNTTP